MHAILHMHDFFGGLPEPIKQDIVEQSVERKVSKGQAVYRKGDQSREIYRLQSGMIKLCNYSLDGVEILTGELKSGDCFGEMGVIDGLPRISHAVASMDSILSVLTAQRFNSLRDKHAEIDRHINIVLCRRVRFLYSLNEESAGLKLNHRLARVLHRLAYSHGDKNSQGGIEIQISHEALSKMLSASRQSVSKELKQLQLAGDIDLLYGKICILRLSHFAQKYQTSDGAEQLTARY